MKSVHGVSIKLAIPTFAAALSLAAVTTTPAAAQGKPPQAAAPTAPVASGSCEPTKKKYKVSKTTQTTSSGTDVIVTDTNIVFSQGGASPSCVIIFFSAEALTTVNNTVMVVGADIDNVFGSCEPTGTFFTQGITGYASHAMNFVCPSVAPGSHVARIKFHRTGPGNASIDFRTTIVNYK
jgi:hypothetical protein